MLASILPGFRDVRTPLATGYLYLVVAWLAFGGWVVDKATESTLGMRVADLSDMVGRAGDLIAVSFAAYLLGSLLTVRNFDKWTASLNVEWLNSRLGLNPEVIGWIEKKAYLPADAGHSGDDVMSATERIMDEPNQKYYPVELRTALEEESHRGWEKVDRTTGEQPDWRAVFKATLSRCVLGERELYIARLQTNHQAVWNEYDRLQGEAELRLSILAPLTALVAVMVAIWTPFALLLLVIPVWLFLQGVWLLRDANSIVWNALVTGTVESPLVGAFEVFASP